VPPGPYTWEGSLLKASTGVVVLCDARTHEDGRPRGLDTMNDAVARVFASSIASLDALYKMWDAYVADDATDVMRVAARDAALAAMKQAAGVPT